jgi:hypothetical protein
MLISSGPPGCHCRTNRFSVVRFEEYGFTIAN